MHPSGRTILEGDSAAGSSLELYEAACMRVAEHTDPKLPIQLFDQILISAVNPATLCNIRSLVNALEACDATALSLLQLAPKCAPIPVAKQPSMSQELEVRCEIYE